MMIINIIFLILLYYGFFFFLLFFFVLCIFGIIIGNLKLETLMSLILINFY
jgi:hypothetical protein